jgi:hypothetical protein
MTKLVVGKDKGFDSMECWLVDDMFGDEFLNYFLLGKKTQL